MTNLFKASDRKLLTKLCGLTQQKMLNTMSAFLKSKYEDGNVVTTEDYIYAKGNIPIALLAHMDTVFPIPARDIYFDPEQEIMWSPQGLGADDRAGIFLIVKIIQAGYKPHIILTTDEEYGGYGADALVKDCPEAFTAMNYLIQLDRHGTNDCVFYDLDNPEFETYIESFGFETARGTFTDISIICPKWKIAGVNLSVGYKDEHSYTETLNTRAMMITCRKVIQMLKDAGNIEKPYQYIPSAASLKGYNYADKYDINQYPGHEMSYCSGCYKTMSEYELFPVVVDETGETINLCPDCLTKYAQWCSVCEYPYLKALDHEKTGVCPVCKKNVEVVNAGSQTN